jgi:outer membrane protein TolC
MSRRLLKVAMGIDVDNPTTPDASLREVNVLDVSANDPTHRAILELNGLGLDRLDKVRDEERIWRLADAQRTDLRQIRFTEKLRRSQLSAERASYYPRLFAFANYQLSAQQDGPPKFFGESSQDRTSNWATGLRLELPIFRGGGRAARVAQRKLEIEQNLTLAREIEEVARGQIRTVLERVEEARLRTEAQHRAVNQAQRGFEIASLEFSEGTGSQLQVTDAEDALRQSEFNYAQAIYDYLVARAQLDLAVGVVPGVDEPHDLGTTKEQLP